MAEKDVPSPVVTPVVPDKRYNVIISFALTNSDKPTEPAMCANDLHYNGLKMTDVLTIEQALIGLLTQLNEMGWSRAGGRPTA